jgi:protein-tyrosine-phosphatase
MSRDDLAPMPTAVLFACSSNSVRSPMAAALTRHYYGTRMRVLSAGVEAREIDPFTVAVMAERGIDLSAYRPQKFAAFDASGIDLIISLTPEAHHHALQLFAASSCTVEYWPTRDPTLERDLGRGREQILDTYRGVRDELEARILGRFSEGPTGSL